MKDLLRLGRTVVPRRLSTATSAPPPPHVSFVVDEISKLTLLEVSYLTDMLREKLKMEEMPVMMPGKGKEEIKEKTAFYLKLKSFDAVGKIKVIKEAVTDLGLKEVKDLLEGAPAVLKKGVTKEEAEKIVAKLKEVEAKVVME